MLRKPETRGRRQVWLRQPPPDSGDIDHCDLWRSRAPQGDLRRSALATEPVQHHCRLDSGQNSVEKTYDGESFGCRRTTLTSFWIKDEETKSFFDKLGTYYQLHLLLRLSLTHKLFDVPQLTLEFLTLTVLI